MNPSSPTSGVVLSITPFSSPLLWQERFGPTNRQPWMVTVLTFSVLPDVISPSMKMKEHVIFPPPVVSNVGLLSLSLNFPLSPGPGYHSQLPVCVGLWTMHMAFSPLNPPEPGFDRQRPISGTPVTGYSAAAAVDDPAASTANAAKTHIPSLVPLSLICIHSPAARLWLPDSLRPRCTPFGIPASQAGTARSA